MGFLSEMVAEVRRDLERRPLDEVELDALARAMPPARDLGAALRSGRPGIIAEVKRASPSAGQIADSDPARLAASYEAAGATAVSVLTEPRHFAGSLADLREVARATTIPVLRKDFLVNRAQLTQARAEGADAVLLIAACLSPDELTELLQAAASLSLAALVETHTEDDLEKAVAVGAEIVGVNARDLETLEVNEKRALELLSQVPRDRVAVFESGLSTREQVERAIEAGARAVLVGEALMRAEDPGQKIRELLGKTA